MLRVSNVQQFVTDILMFAPATQAKRQPIKSRQFTSGPQWGTQPAHRAPARSGFYGGSRGVLLIAGVSIQAAVRHRGESDGEKPASWYKSVVDERIGDYRQVNQLGRITSGSPIILP
jgi:hypothetical protein